MIDTRLTSPDTATDLTKMIGTDLGYAEGFKLGPGLFESLAVLHVDEADSQRNGPAQGFSDVRSGS